VKYLDCEGSLPTSRKKGGKGPAVETIIRGGETVQNYENSVADTITQQILGKKNVVIQGPGAKLKGRGRKNP